MARKQNLRETVYSSLRKRMLEGDITYATRLVDHEIAEALGVSRMPVREALMQLKSEGYLEGTARGFKLRRFAPLDLAQIFEVRILLEPQAAVQACRALSVQGLGEMQGAVREAADAHEADSVVRFLYAGWRFRRAWLEMNPNPHLSQTLDRLHDHSDLARASALRRTEVRAGTLERMQGIVEAFVRQDCEEVSRRVEANLRLCGMVYYAEQVELLRQDEG